MIDWTYHGYRGRQRKLAADYIEYFNDFLTAHGFAVYYGLSQRKVEKSLIKGRALFNATFGPVA